MGGHGGGGRVMASPPAERDDLTDMLLFGVTARRRETERGGDERGSRKARFCFLDYWKYSY